MFLSMNKPFVYTVNKTFAPDKHVHVYTCYMFIEMKKFHDGEAIDDGEAAVECVDCIFGRLLQVKASILFSPYDRHNLTNNIATFFGKELTTLNIHLIYILNKIKECLYFLYSVISLTIFLL